jgi:NTE family protein
MPPSGSAGQRSAANAVARGEAARGRGGTALVLSGGGARAAYQIGVLRGLVDHGFLPRGRSGFEVFVGSSAGAINAAALAASADEFDAGLVRLARVWGEIRPQQVFRTDIASLGRTGVRWAWDLSFGGALRRVRPKSLLDTTPLRALLADRVPLARLDVNLEAGALRALALVATDLHTSNGVVFLHASADTAGWTRRRWRIERTTIRTEHLLASSAIPIFFPSVAIGGRHYGDGSIRNTTPLSPAINLGVDRIVAVGVSGPPPREGERGPRRPPTIAQIAGVLLDAVMLDAIEVDVEHSERVNTSVLRCATGDPAQPFRRVEVLWLRPSRLVRKLASEFAHRIPPAVRYLMRGLGPDVATTELASYLLFDAEFCGRLVELGARDVAAERDRIEEFFANSSKGSLRARQADG